LPIIPTVIFGEDHIVQDGAELLSVDPEQDLALGDAGLSREVVARQGDTTVAVGRPRKERMGEFLREHLLGIAPALGGPQDLDRDGWQALIGEQPLMGGRIRGVEEGLLALCQGTRGTGERKLRVIEPSLAIKMGLDPVEITLPLWTHDGLMVDRQPSADGFKGIRRLGPATL